LTEQRAEALIIYKGRDKVEAKYKLGDLAYIVESNRWIREVKIVKIAGGFYTLQFTDTGGGTKLRENRLFETKEQAEASKR